MAEQPRGCRTVFVKNLPYDADEDGVSEALAGCGRIASVRLAMWNHTRKLKVRAFIGYKLVPSTGTRILHQAFPPWFLRVMQKENNAIFRLDETKTSTEAPFDKRFLQRL